MDLYNIDIKEGDKFITVNGTEVTFVEKDEFGLYIFEGCGSVISYRPNGTRYNSNHGLLDIVKKVEVVDDTPEARVQAAIDGNKNVYDYIEEVPDTDEFKKDYEDYLKYRFSMSPVEYARYKQFCSDHKHSDVNRGAIGGGTVISYMGTGLGSIVHVKCGICGAEVDITDNSCW